MRVITYQHVFWFYISMKETMFMHKCKPLKRLVHYVSYFGFWEVFISLLHHLIQIAIHEFKHKVKLIVLADDFPKLDDIGVVQLFQTLQMYALYTRYTHKWVFFSMITYFHAGKPQLTFISRNCIHSSKEQNFFFIFLIAVCSLQTIVQIRRYQ